ncbi:MAG: (Fe-S)-binding protein [Hyphomicrobiaceae bacterium]
MSSTPTSKAEHSRRVDADAAVAKFRAATSGNMATYVSACVHCGQCAEACHFYQATKDPRHTPAFKLRPMLKAHRAMTSPLSWIGLAPKLTEEYLRATEDLIFDTCTMCGRCTQVCPMGIDIASIVAISRQAYAAAGLGPPDLMEAAEASRDKGSPLGLTPEKLEDRIEWLADEHDVEIPLDKERAEVLLTVSSIETMKYPMSIVAMAKLMNHAGVNWTFSSKGYESTNFGYLAGKTPIARTMVERIVIAAEAAGAKTVVIPECGHAFGVMRFAAANIIGRQLPFEVRHITEYLADLKRQGRIKLKPMAEAFTYHDPCQISRRGGAAAEVRYLLKGFAEDFREMSPTGNFNWCCGGGGGVQAMSRAAEVRHKVFRIKMDQVEATGANKLVSACSNCRLTMDESKAHYQWPNDIDSLVEVLADHLDETSATSEAAE